MQTLSNLIADRKANDDFMIAYEALRDYRESTDDPVETVNRSIYESPLIYYSDLRAYIRDHVELVEEWINENTPEAPINLWNVIAETETEERMRRVAPHVGDAAFVVAVEEIAEQFPQLLNEDENGSIAAVIADEVENEIASCYCLGDIVKTCRQLVEYSYSEEDEE